MNAIKLAQNYKERFKNFGTCRQNALVNLVNRNDIYRPGNKFISDFWIELHKLFN